MIIDVRNVNISCGRKGDKFDYSKIKKSCYEKKSIVIKKRRKKISIFFCQKKSIFFRQKKISIYIYTEWLDIQKDDIETIKYN